jgi:HPt (histidine-containing phosphotransfer) domain-containing protein
MNEVQIFAYEDALDRVDNDVILLREIIEIFFQEVERNSKDLRDAFSARDQKKFVRAAHSIKGAAANVGAMRVSALAGKIEKLGAHDLVAANELAEGLAQEVAVFRLSFPDILNSKSS